MIDADNETHWIGQAEQKYYVLAQYARHIRPGFTIIDSGEEKTVAAYNTQTRQLVLVTLNDGPGQFVRYDLSRFAGAAGSVVRHWRTHLGSGDRYRSQTEITLGSSSFSVWLDENCVQTFVIGLTVIDSDCFLDLNDFAVLASQWMNPPGVPSADIAPPVSGDGIVDSLDLTLFFENWLMDGTTSASFGTR